MDNWDIYEDYIDSDYKYLETYEDVEAKIADAYKEYLFDIDDYKQYTGLLD